MSFADVPIRTNSDEVTVSWWNLLRTAGLGAAQGRKFTKTYVDVAAAATSNDIELFSLAANEVLLGSIIKHTTAFSGGTISAMTASLGITGDLTLFTPTFNVFQAVADATHLFTWNPNIVSFVSGGNAATSVRLSMVSTGDDLDNATAGALEIYAFTARLPTS